MNQFPMLTDKHLKCTEIPEMLGSRDILKRIRRDYRPEPQPQALVNLQLVSKKKKKTRTKGLFVVRVQQQNPGGYRSVLETLGSKIRNLRRDSLNCLRRGLGHGRPSRPCPP